MKVSYSKGRTINTGNYESLRIDVSAEMEADDFETAYNEARSFVDTKLNEETGASEIGI